MKLGLFETLGAAPAYGVLRGDGIVSLEGLLGGDTPQEQLHALIAEFDSLRPRVEALAASAKSLPLESVRQLPPVPWPGKILLTTATYGDRTEGAPPQLLATLKSPESVIGPGDTVRLPAVDVGTWQFVPRAMLGVVVRGPARAISAEDWQTAVFGYTCVIDVMARGDAQFGRDYWLAKADTLGPLGPCIVTADEVPDPTALRIRSWQNDAPAQDFSVADASHSIAEQVAFATTVMTLHTGDVLACGTSAVGLRPLSEGDKIEVEIDAIGRFSVSVATPVRAAP